MFPGNNGKTYVSWYKANGDIELCTMKIKGGTKRLIAVLEQTLPHVRDTKVMNHLAQIHPSKNGKGKVIDFKWLKRDFRLTSNAKVSEYIFGLDAYLD